MSICSKPLSICSKPLSICSKRLSICSKPLSICSKRLSICSKPLSMSPKCLSISSRHLSTLSKRLNICSSLLVTNSAIAFKSFFSSIFSPFCFRKHSAYFSYNISNILATSYNSLPIKKKVSSFLILFYSSLSFKAWIPRIPEFRYE